jgi:lysophospholipase L1-like esterase
MADQPRARRGTPARPLRIVVIGSSTVFMTVPRPKPEEDSSPYGILLREELLRRGITAEVNVHARWHTTIREVLPFFEPWVRDHFPDVVVVNLGMAECQARVVPTWLYRNSVTWLPGLSDASVAYRKRVVPHLRRSIRRWQRATVGKVPLRGSRVPPGTFERAMRRLVRLCSDDLQATVLVLDIDAPGRRVLELQPGLDRRADAYNRILRRVVDTAQGSALLIETSKVVADDPESLLPDGFHRSAEGHRRVAETLAEAIALRVDP